MKKASVKFMIFDPSDDIEDGKDNAIFKRMRQEGIEPEFRYPMLFKRDPKEGERMWQVGYRVDKNELFTRWGMTDEDSKIQESVDNPVPKGKKTELEQAIQKMRKLYEKKTEGGRGGYVRDGEEEEAIKPSKPMLADTYNFEIKYLKKSNNEWAQRMVKYVEKDPKYKPTKINFPIAMSVKLDGMRIMTQKANGEIIFKSRDGKIRDNLGMFKIPLKFLLKYLPQGTEIDGEMYGFLPIRDEDGEIISQHGNFQDTLSTLNKKVRVTEEDETKIIKNVKYCIFDLNIPGPYEYRYWKLLRAFQKLREDEDYISYNEELRDKYNFDTLKEAEQLCMLNSFIANTKGDIQRFQDEALKNGFEGIMLKNLFYSDQTTQGWKKSEYRTTGSRCSNILKVKYFWDSDGIVVNIFPGKAAKEKNFAMFRIRANNGKEFNCRPAATESMREEYLRNKKNYIGRVYTYKHYGVSSDGLPRFATGLKFRDDEDVPEGEYETDYEE